MSVKVKLAKGTETFVLFIDGDNWCAVREDFENSEESCVGFGTWAEDAMDDLLAAETVNRVVKS